MSAPRLYLTTGFATGTLSARIALLDYCRTTEQIDNNDSLQCRVKLPFPASVMMRATVRLFGADGRQREYRIRNVVEDEGGAWADIDCASPWAEIARAGLIRTVQNGDVAFSQGGQLTVTQWLLNYFMLNSTTDGLTWLSTTLGTIENDKLIALQFDRWNRQQLVQTLAQESLTEPYLYQSAPGALYQIAFPLKRGSTLPVYNGTRKRVIKRARQLADAEIANVLAPLGETVTGGVEPANISENSWQTTVVATGWVALTDPDTGEKPVVMDDMFKLKYIEVPSGVTIARRQILNSRASDGAIELADTSLLTNVGMRVRIVEDSSGTPLHSVHNPASITRYGAVQAPFPVAGARGERNWAPNGLFTLGTTGYNANIGGWVEAHPTTEVGADVSGQANGSFSPLSSSIVVDNFPPNTVIRKGSLFQVDGAALCTAPPGLGHTIKSDGKCHISLSGSLAYNIFDNQYLQMSWTDDNGQARLQAVQVDGNQTAGTGGLNLKNFGAHESARKMKNGDKVKFAFGGTYYTPPASGFILYNPSGSQNTVTVSIPVPTNGFTDPQLVPQTMTPLAGGTPVVFRDNVNGLVFDATVNTGFTVGGAYMTLDISLPGNFNFSYYPYLSQVSIEVVQETSVTVTNTDADAEFDEDSTRLIHWTGALPADYETSRALWIDGATNQPIAVLGIIFGLGWATLGSTAADLYWPSRPKVFPSATFSDGGISAELLYAGATVVLDNAGAGTVPLMFGNLNTVVNNTVIKLYRNSYGWGTVAKKFVMRVVNGMLSDAFTLFARGTVPRQAWVQVFGSLYVTIGTNTWSQVPVTTTPVIVDVVDALTGQALGSQTVNVDVSQMHLTARPLPVEWGVTVPVSVSGPRSVKLRVTCASASASQVLVQLMLTGVQAVISPDAEVPITLNSHANALMLSGIRQLQQNDIVSPSVSGVVADTSLGLGQLVTVRDFSVTQRAVALSIDHWDGALVTASFDRIRKDASMLLAGAL